MKKFFQKAPETKVHNPLNQKVNDFITIAGHENLYQVLSLQELEREIGGESFLLTDYNVSDGDPEHTVKLRFMDGCNVLLFKVDEFEYNEEFEEYMDEQVVEFEEAAYCRVNDVTERYQATVTDIADLDGDGVAEKDEVRTSKITYWDFWRETTDDFDNVVTEFLVVEMDPNGYFTAWRGEEIARTSINGGN
jgi:hypothetical protein